MSNQDLIQIRNPKTVEKVYDTLNISFRDEKDIAPIICGTVING